MINLTDKLFVNNILNQLYQNMEDIQNYPEKYYTRQIQQNLKDKLPCEKELLKVFSNFQQLHKSIAKKIPEDAYKRKKQEIKSIYKEIKRKNKLLQQTFFSQQITKLFEEMDQPQIYDPNYIIQLIEQLFQFQIFVQNKLSQSSIEDYQTNEFILKTLKQKFLVKKKTLYVLDEQNHDQNDLKSQMKKLKKDLEKSELEKDVKSQEIQLLNQQISEQNERIEKIRKEHNIVYKNIEKNQNQQHINFSIIEEKQQQYFNIQENETKQKSQIALNLQLQQQLQDIEVKNQILRSSNQNYQFEVQKKSEQVQELKLQLSNLIDQNNLLLKKQQSYDKDQKQQNLTQKIISDKFENQQSLIKFQQQALNSISCEKEQILHKVSKNILNIHKQKLENKIYESQAQLQIRKNCSSATLKRNHDLSFQGNNTTFYEKSIHSRMNLEKENQLRYSTQSLQKSSSNASFSQSKNTFLEMAKSPKSQQNRELIQNFFKSHAYKNYNSKIYEQAYMKNKFNL